MREVPYLRLVRDGEGDSPEKSNIVGITKNRQEGSPFTDEDAKDRRQRELSRAEVKRLLFPDPHDDDAA